MFKLNHVENNLKEILKIQKFLLQIRLNRVKLTCNKEILLSHS